MRFCLLLVCLLATSLVEAQMMPEYSAVLKKIYKVYETEIMSPFQLMKKRDGWWIAELDYSTGTTVRKNEKLYWNKKTGNFTALNYPKRKTPLNSQEELYAHGYRATDAYNYERCIYYGYDDWSSDVIQDLGHRKDLSNEELESLARAYSHYAMPFLGNNQWLYAANPTGAHRDKMKYTVLPQNRVDSFLKYSEAELMTIQKIIGRDPNYPVIVGHIRNKMANECMHIYHQLHMAGRGEYAEQFLLRAQYDPLRISTAKNFLNGLPANAILFTNGDNDTYPVWYVQQALNHRRDVCVMNISLLGIKKYVDLTTTPGSPFGTVRMKYRNSGGYKNKYIKSEVVENRSEKLHRVQDADTLLMQLYDDTSGNLTFYLDEIYLHNGQDSAFIPASRYYSYTDFAQWEIFNSNKRPVYYTFWGAEENNTFRQLSLEGVNYRFRKINDEKPLRIDSAGTSGFWLNHFTPPEADTMDAAVTDWSMQALFSEYYKSLSAAIQYHYHLGQKETVRQLIDIGMNLYPDHGLHYNSGLGPFIRAVAATGDMSKTGLLLPRYLQMCRDEHAAWLATSNEEEENALIFHSNQQYEVEAMKYEPALDQFLPAIDQCLDELKAMK
ncbi:MAG: hypothetical protein JNL57_02480 [Bacteroidetes bacterium]|nr:hypothetical protein [Bacteroidota bacterium]